MLTTHPSIMLGSFFWEEDRVPRDEFDIRLAPLRAAMRDRGLAATIVYGDARTHEGLCYFSNFIPRMRWTMALIPVEGEPLLLVSMSSRDMPAMRGATWIGDVKSGWEWQWFDGFLDKLKAPGKLGTIGFDLMTSVLAAQIEKSVTGKFETVAIDDVLADARATHRPREIALIRVAADIADRAGAAMSKRWTDGDDVETAALAGEMLARGDAAHDVRTLVSRDGGRTIEPYQARFDSRPESLLGYVAVKYQGYWGERFVAVGAGDTGERVRETLDAVLQALRPGIDADALHDIATKALGDLSFHPILGGSLGHRIGLSPDEGGRLVRGSGTHVLAECVTALRIGALDADGRGAIASAMVRLREDGTVDVLNRADPE